MEDLTERVSEALLEISEDAIIVVHCFDNMVYMARSEEGGDLPIRRFPDGSYHIEGDLVLAGKERVLMYFKNCLPFLKLLEGRRVVFLTTLPRYLRGCCERSDHAANCQEEGFEEQLRKCLAECRGFYIYHCESWSLPSTQGGQRGRDRCMGQGPCSSYQGRV